MPHPQLPVEGGCMCGRLRMRISVAPIITMACHCRGCQQLERLLLQQQLRRA